MPVSGAGPLGSIWPGSVLRDAARSQMSGFDKPELLKLPTLLPINHTNHTAYAHTIKQHVSLRDPLANSASVGSSLSYILGDRSMEVGSSGTPQTALPTSRRNVPVPEAIRTVSRAHAIKPRINSAQRARFADSLNKHALRCRAKRRSAALALLILENYPSGAVRNLKRKSETP